MPQNPAILEHHKKQKGKISSFYSRKEKGVLGTFHGSGSRTDLLIFWATENPDPQLPSCAVPTHQPRSPHRRTCNGALGFTHQMRGVLPDLWHPIAFVPTGNFVIRQLDFRNNLASIFNCSESGRRQSRVMKIIVFTYYTFSHFLCVFFVFSRGKNCWYYSCEVKYVKELRNR